ncbi:interferon-induced protein 44 isoform X1 [Oryzias melastigma]|uniref:G domain-containing protein n=1 Tax=Oryzias melastigma TaxID=30732 RepID=A0A3B3BCK6_ORYME|nr:interferon-induced protein 44 isoform X1 [Oryzias melastigma]XP_036067436.1 interferon-induced protein 44 isoform X1 [Oryzias melastigma]XP_036067437.1 interferon-induced protein 44 isoform X1 [Oryzias melastigma]
MDKTKEKSKIKPSLFNFGAISEPPEPPSCEPPSFLHDTRPKTVSSIFGDIKPEEKKENNAFKLPDFSAAQAKFDVPWRNMEWTEEHKKSLMKTVSSYRPSCEKITQAQVLVLGPVGSGKSSFISSVQSVFHGRVVNRAMVGSMSTSFTKKLQTFNIQVQKGEDSGLVMCDIKGIGDGEMTGLTLHDIVSVIKGHVPNGHKFSLEQPVSSETVGYVKTPTLAEKIHCVAFVVDASKITTYPKSIGATFRRLREQISDLGVHQVALLTHIDRICAATAADVSQVYKSPNVQDVMNKAGALLGMSTSYIIPVKNYSSELDLDLKKDVLLLSAVDHILQYTELFYQDYKPNKKQVVC